MIYIITIPLGLLANYKVLQLHKQYHTSYFSKVPSGFNLLLITILHMIGVQLGGKSNFLVPFETSISSLIDSLQKSELDDKKSFFKDEGSPLTQ